MNSTTAVAGLPENARESQSCEGVPRRQSHRRSGLANLPSVGAVP